jgi:heme exporter protein D
MIKIIIIWLAVTIAVEALIELVVDSTMPVLNWWRNQLNKWNPRFFGKLFSCGYCFSVWVAASVAWALPGSLVECWWLDIIIKTFLLHRLSNVMHKIISRLMNRLPFEIVVTSIRGELENNKEVTIEDGEGESKHE